MSSIFCPKSVADSGNGEHIYIHIYIMRMCHSRHTKIAPGGISGRVKKLCISSKVKFEAYLKEI